MLEIKNDGAGAKSHGMELRKGPERLVPCTLNTTPQAFGRDLHNCRGNASCPVPVPLIEYEGQCSMEEE
jgi:hypothetical protein